MIDGDDWKTKSNADRGHIIPTPFTHPSPVNLVLSRIIHPLFPSIVPLDNSEQILYCCYHIISLYCIPTYPYCCHDNM